MSAYKRVRQLREKPDRVVTLMPKEAVQAVDAWGVTMGLPSRSETIRALLEKGLKAAGGELGGTTPAAGKARENQPEADSHATE